MRLVFISDTHGLHNVMSSYNGDIMHGDILFHSGDFTSVGMREEIINFNNWLGRQNFRHKSFAQNKPQ